MSVEDFVTTFGYPALFAGAFLEGETFLFLAGFMAHRGYLDLSLVMLTGFIVIGMSGFKTREFLGLNAVGAALWALIIATAGYFFGQALEAVMEDVKHYELGIVIALTAIGVSIWLIRYRLLLRRERVGHAKRRS